MKKFLFPVCVMLSVFQLSFSQQQSSEPTSGYFVQQVLMAKWDSQDGLHYKAVAGANLGVTSFAVVDKNRIAFLSDASNEIIITDQSTGKITNRFSVSFAPRDFVYDSGSFYVLNENQINIYDENGNSIKNIPYPNSYVGVERLTRYNNSTYLLLPSGNSVKIESDGNAVDPSGYKGWITSAGNFVATKLNGDNSYSVKVITADGNSYEKTLTTDKKVGGVYVVGSTSNRVFLDVQTYVTEIPISVERHIVSVELNINGLGNIISDIKVPDCYYVLSNKDFSVSSEGSILNMITSPLGVFIFSLTETEIAKAQNYPASLLNIKYHFNDHLLQVNEK